jgi:hypothetical protein
MRFTTVVLLPPDTPDSMAAVTRLMSPYDTKHEEAAYKQYVDAGEAARLAAHFGAHGHPVATLEELATTMTELTGDETGVEDGRLFWITTANPQGHWDGWMLHSLQEDVWPVPTMPRDLRFFDVVTPDGHWHEFGWKWDLPDEEKAEVYRHAYALVDRFPDHLAIVLDCHA